MDRRNNLIEWCVLRTGYNHAYFEKMSEGDLEKEFNRIMEVASNEMLENHKEAK
ncbi:hypothetical protein [Bacillus infantis]|uniref:hypothetical protein n=1 Tax=Bacillus infantis TaxID=324767 RepID=UPI001653BE6A|nr:hypothetical protein [Bacillus infantis]